MVQGAIVVSRKVDFLGWSVSHSTLFLLLGATLSGALGLTLDCTQVSLLTGLNLHIFEPQLTVCKTTLPTIPLLLP